VSNEQWQVAIVQAELRIAQTIAALAAEEGRQQ
jgi:hypothetical protein